LKLTAFNESSEVSKYLEASSCWYKSEGTDGQTRDTSRMQNTQLLQPNRGGREWSLFSVDTSSHIIASSSCAYIG